MLCIQRVSVPKVLGGPNNGYNKMNKENVDKCVERW